MCARRVTASLFLLGMVFIEPQLSIPFLGSSHAAGAGSSSTSRCAESLYDENHVKAEPERRKAKLTDAVFAELTTTTACFYCKYAHQALIELYSNGEHPLYFVSLPGWFFTAVLYILLSAFYQNYVYEKNWKKALAQISSIVILVVIVLLPVLFLTGAIELESVKVGLWILSIVWFIAAAIWMWKDNSTE